MVTPAASTPPSFAKRLYEGHATGVQKRLTDLAWAEFGKAWLAQSSSWGRWVHDPTNDRIAFVDAAEIPGGNQGTVRLEIRFQGRQQSVDFKVNVPTSGEPKLDGKMDLSAFSPFGFREEDLFGSTAEKPAQLPAAPPASASPTNAGISAPASSANACPPVPVLPGDDLVTSKLI